MFYLPHKYSKWTNKLLLLLTYQCQAETYVGKYLNKTFLFELFEICQFSMLRVVWSMDCIGKSTTMENQWTAQRKDIFTLKTRF